MLLVVTEVEVSHYQPMEMKTLAPYLAFYEYPDGDVGNLMIIL
jgi:hypothetical protein